MSFIIPLLIGQIITTPVNKLIEFNVSADYQPKTNSNQENIYVEDISNIWHNQFNKDNLILSGGVSVRLPLGISFNLEDQNEKQKGIITNKTEGREDMIISYESSKNIILLTGKKSLTNSNFKSSIGLGFRLENEIEKENYSPRKNVIDNFKRNNSQLVFLGEMGYNGLPVKLFLQGNYGTKLSGSENFLRTSTLTGDELMKEELSQKGSKLELTLGGKVPVGKTNFGLTYTLQSDKRNLTGIVADPNGPANFYQLEGQYTTNKQLIQFFTEFAFGLVLKVGYSMEDFTKKGGIVEIKTVEGGSGLTVGCEYNVGFGNK
jgi:hypothetical protein